MQAVPHLSLSPQLPTGLLVPWLERGQIQELLTVRDPVFSLSSASWHTADSGCFLKEASLCLHSGKEQDGPQGKATPAPGDGLEGQFMACLGPRGSLDLLTCREWQRLSKSWWRTSKVRTRVPAHTHTVHRDTHLSPRRRGSSRCLFSRLPKSRSSKPQ